MFGKKLFIKSKILLLVYSAINDKMLSLSKNDKKRNFFSLLRSVFGMFFDGVGN